MHILVDGTPVAGASGQSVAAALLAAGILHLRDSPRAGAPRGAFCLTGICQECVLEIDGARTQACLVPVRPALSVRLGGQRA